MRRNTAFKTFVNDTLGNLKPFAHIIIRFKLFATTISASSVTARSGHRWSRDPWTVGRTRAARACGRGAGDLQLGSDESSSRIR
ncbi:hypothetical protein Y032_0699g1635 [Ancylostoma ceylanicum]|nr:hypothetical protein Y032_0699g1635 [Ancylostoma ceylanicum]